jgi:hypothetical protein
VPPPLNDHIRGFTELAAAIVASRRLKDLYREEDNQKLVEEAAYIGSALDYWLVDMAKEF